MFVLETCSIPVMEISSPIETCLTNRVGFENALYFVETHGKQICCCRVNLATAFFPPLLGGGWRKARGWVSQLQPFHIGT